jgi:hypothetical protein
MPLRPPPPNPPPPRLNGETLTLGQRVTIAACLTFALVVTGLASAFVFQRPIDKRVEREPVRASVPCSSVQAAEWRNP